MNITNSYNKKEKLLISFIWLIQYFNILFFPILITIILLVKYRNKSVYLSKVCKKALNFSLSIVIYYLITFIFGFITNHTNSDYLFYIFLLLTILFLLFSNILFLIYPIIEIKKA